MKRVVRAFQRCIFSQRPRDRDKSQAFTLIEAVVIAMVVVVLSAIAVPIYTGYLNKARRDRVKGLTATAAAAANAHFRRTGAHPDSADLNVYMSDPSRFKVEVDATNRLVIITDTEPAEEIKDTAAY